MWVVGALGDKSGAAAPLCGGGAPATLGPGAGGHLVLDEDHRQRPACVSAGAHSLTFKQTLVLQITLHALAQRNWHPGFAVIIDVRVQGDHARIYLLLQPY